MDSILLTSAICFTIAGFGIPICGTQVILDSYAPLSARISIGVAVVTWIVSLSISVAGLVALA